MGKTKLKTIDDSVQESHSTSKEVSRDKEKTPKREKILAINKERAKSESNKATGEQVTQLPGDLRARSEESGPSGALRPDERASEKETSKQGQPKPRSKKYQEASEKVERNKNYPVGEAVQLAKDVSYSKFDGSLEIHINTNVKNLRGLVSLPYASGKKLTILAFGKNAASSGADIVGDEDKLKEIEKGKVDFDVLITTPEWMPALARLAKVLGPRGLMPNPKNGTISDHLKKAVEGIQSGKTEYKSEKAANVIHLSLGKLSQPNEQLVENIKILLQAIGKSKMKKATLSPTMGPGIKVDLSVI